MKDRACKTCGRSLVLSQHRLEGASEGWKVELIEYPVLTCPEGHELREAFPDFQTGWFEELSEALGFYTKKGLFARTYKCRGCKRDLVDPTNTRIEVQLRVKPGFGFRVNVVGSAMRCPCGVTSIRAVESDLLSDALINALDSSKIKRL